MGAAASVLGRSRVDRRRLGQDLQPDSFLLGQESNVSPCCFRSRRHFGSSSFHNLRMNADELQSWLVDMFFFFSSTWTVYLQATKAGSDLLKLNMNTRSLTLKSCPSPPDAYSASESVSRDELVSNSKARTETPTQKTDIKNNTTPKHCWDVCARVGPRHRKICIEKIRALGL